MLATGLALLGAVLVTTDTLLGLYRSAVGVSASLPLPHLPDWSTALAKTSQCVYRLRRELQFKSRYLELLIQDHRDYQMKGLQSQSPFVLDLEKIFVPLRVSAQSPHKISSHMLQTGKTDKTHDIWDYLAADPQILNRCMAILGPPGSGKTTLLGHLTLVYAHRAYGEYHRQAPAALIPIFLSLRDHREQLSGLVPPNLADLIQQQAKLQRIQPPADWFRKRLRKGQCLVLLDGLDEVAEVRPEIRRALLDKIEIGLEADDPEISEIAAHVKLSLRLNKALQPLDDHIFIDSSLISCAEYQLFIDAMREQGKNRWPLHWSGHHFATGHSSRPVTGMRMQDAQTFCRWLSARDGGLGYNYRLPARSEAAAKPLANGSLGYWCGDGTLEVEQLHSHGDHVQQLYQQILNDIFMQTGPYDFAAMVNGLRPVIDDRGQHSERELTRALLLIVIAACRISGHANAGKTAGLTGKPDKQISHQVFAIYSYCNLMERRHNGRLPAWEGLRIVWEYRL
jgi:energy-coupling factor transporter ATP-binding protein EcfA2